MAQDNTGQVPTKVVIKVVEKYLEHLLESLFLTFHKQVYERCVFFLINLTKLSIYPTAKILKLYHL